MMYEQDYGYDMGMTKPTMSWGGEAGGFTMDDMYRLPSAQTGMPKTTATSGSTTPTSSSMYTPWNGDTNWANVNGLNVPVWSKDDFVFNKNASYDPNAPAQEMYWRESGDQTFQDYRDNPNAVQGNWDLTEAARQRLIAGGWDPKNTNNIGFNPSYSGGQIHSGGMGMLAGATDPNKNPFESIRNGIYKNSDSTILNYDYQMDPATGRMVPVAAGGGNWITNSGEHNRKTVAAFGGLVGAGLAIPAIAGALGGAAGGAATGATGAEAGVGGLVELGGGGAGYTGSVPGITSTSALSGAGGAEAGVGGLIELGQGGAGYTGSVPSTVTSTSSLEAPWYEQVFNAAKQANEYKGYYDKANQALQLAQGETGGVPDKGNQGSGARTIADLIAGYYSSQQNKDLSGNLKGMYSDQQAKQDFFRKLLEQSYTDPDSFYGSNQFKALDKIYGNKIDRQAATSGRMANDIDRTVLREAHAMKAMQDYRSGLNQQMQTLDPIRMAQIGAEGYGFEANANNPFFAQVGNQRGSNGITNRAQQVNDTWNTIQDTASTAEDVWNFISKWF